MAIIFAQTDTAADSGFNVGSSGETAGLTTYSTEILDGGTLGVGTGTTDIDNSGTDVEFAVIGFQTDTGGPEPNDTSWESGDYVVRLNVSTGRTGISWRATYVMARTSGGSYTTVASLTGQTDSLASPGVVTHTVVLGSDYTANATDTMYILCVFGGQLTHGNSTVIITNDQNIDTPIASADVEEALTTVFSTGAAGDLDKTNDVDITNVLATAAEGDLVASIIVPPFPYHVIKQNRRDLQAIVTL